jgi:hypothetical protein
MVEIMIRRIMHALFREIGRLALAVRPTNPVVIGILD